MSGIRTIDDIRQRCVIDSEAGCWVWAGYLEPKSGRPAMRMEVEPGRRRCVRLSIALHLIKTGRIPAQGSRVYYPATCREMACCNPEHHRLLTKSQINKLVGGHSAASRAKISAANFGKGKLSMQDRADIPAQPLKAKQRALLAVFRRLGPITIKRAALEIHGDMDPLHIRMVHNQMPALASPAGVADHGPGVRGVRPLLWRACA